MRDLKNIDVMWRPAPFWALNDLLEDGELRRQIREFERGGMGGFFMHARSGLETPYLSKQYLDNISACVDEAEKLGMKAWIYDENGWPSGTAGGMVTDQGRKNLARKLVCTPVADSEPLGGEIARCEQEGKEYAFRVCYSCNTDVLDPKVVADFINLTHETYKARFSDKLSSVIPGSFFDEPQYGYYRDEVDFIPWTETLPDRFRETWGYGITEKLASVFFDRPDSARVRTHFYKTLTDMFADSFTGQIGEWCEANGLISTGHLEWEQELYAQICCTGSIMRHYEFETWPGTDQLGSFMAYPWINRQAASVTSQLDKGRTMVECFGVAGENFSLDDRRWLYGVMLALGSDFFVPHISLYSMKTSNKRDHPPFNQYQQPWWGDNRELADSLSRAVGAVTDGKRLSSVLLLNPIVTAHSLYRPGDKAEVDRLQADYEAINYALLNANVIYDIGEETIMAAHGRAENGKLYVGSSCYEAVILLSHKNMLSSTAALLERFAAEGGRVCAVGCRPETEEGVATDRLAALPLELTDDPVAFVRANTAPEAAVETLSGRVWSQMRTAGGKKLWFVTNYDRKAPSSCRVVGGERFGRVDLSTGEVWACSDEILLNAGEFAVIAEGVYPERAEDAFEGRVVPLQNRWAIKTTARSSSLANCVNLDTCSLTLDSETSELLHTSAARAAISGISFTDNRTCRLTFRFENRSASGRMLLAAEAPDVFTVQVNGHTVTPDGGYFVDIAFRTYDITDFVRPGENTVTLTANACSFVPCEDIYLIGDFGCVLEGENRVLTELPTSVEQEGIEKQGYPFFAGEAVLAQRFTLPAGAKRARLRVRPTDGSILRLRLNGVDCGLLWAAPWEAELKGLREGENLLELTVVNTLRNLLGPLHCTRPEWRGAGPMEFSFDSGCWTDGINLVHVGIEELELRAE